MKTNIFRLKDILINYDYLRKPLSSIERENFQGEYPYYGAQGIIDYVKDYLCDGTYMLIAEDGENLSSRKVPIVNIATGKFWVNNHAHIVKTNENANFRYIYYLLNYSDINGYVTGSAQPKLSQRNLNKIKIELPDISIQQKIANILSRYDEAIENNNKRIKLLEQMAQNLYKEWFVRFRFPGWENTEFENGIPKGWKVEKLGNFCKITDGTHDTPAQVEEGIPLVTGKAIRNGRIDFSIPYNISVEDHEKIKKRSGLKTGDILFSNIGTIGNVCLVNYDREFSVKNMIIFKPESINQSMYLFYLLNSDSIQSLFTAQTNGASQQFLGLDFMRRFKILLPSEEIIKLFGEKEVLIIQQINIFQQQNQNLAKQRDLLLPRLMIGKLEV